ncbi:flagellar assembly protein FliW [Kiloniella antarctica]|uniref:Flagellar assembly protein FliW n=1 Tax=Kiloniella antarctica TaxID=1550907 RepID=A0ABW5BR59_9PROT
MLNLEPNFKSLDFAGITMPKTEEVTNNIITLKTRFGVMEIDRDKTIKMPQGMVGFSGHKEFGLTVSPIPVLDGFMLLQSVDEAELTFILKPYDLSSGLISDENLASVIQQLSISPENLGVMLVTTLRRMPGEIKKSVNLRAPLFVDTEKRQAWQYIFNTEDYSVRHEID